MIKILLPESNFMQEEWIFKDSRPLGKITHPATALALEALQCLKSNDFQPDNILDMGCGSGLLSLMAMRLWPEATIMAADISELAVAECRENVAANGFLQHITVIRAEGYNHAKIRKNAPYQLIIANLVSRLHVEYAYETRQHLHEKGLLLVSGILPWLQAQVETTYSAAGFEVMQELKGAGWNGLVLQL